MFLAQTVPNEEVIAGIFNHITIRSEYTAKKWSWFIVQKVQVLKSEKIMWSDEWTQNNLEGRCEAKKSFSLLTEKLEKFGFKIHFY